MRHLFANQGFMPHGFGAVLTGILVTVFSFFGAEIVTIAAAESKRPAEKIRRAINLGGLAHRAVLSAVDFSGGFSGELERSGPAPARTFSTY